MPIVYEAARQLLDEAFAKSGQDLLENRTPEADPHLEEPLDIIFGSNTQAYREVLVGCTIVRIQDKNINIRLPYVKLGANTFNGRTLDERVVNPFFHDNHIPSSKGPYLSAFRRSVRFDETTRSGLRDQEGYDAFLKLISYLERTDNEERLQGFLRHLLFRFAKLRETASVPLARLQRISLEQYDVLLKGLLGTPSGGRFPVILAVAAFRAISEFFHLDWEILSQGINVADAAAGAGADITISSRGAVLLAAEVTERPVDRARIVATFNTKISLHGIEDYLFFVRLNQLDEEARAQARQYFAQGHEVNFLEIKDWILMSLATMGRRGREVFNRILLDLLNDPEMPRSVKVAWNTQVANLLGA